MKQILQSLKTGDIDIANIPCPSLKRKHLLVRSSRTLVSAGTERMLLEFGKAGWINKARQQPDKVKMVLDKIKTDGLAPTVEAVFNKLDQPLPLGYCNFGTVMELGPEVTGFKIGDRVVSNGQHAEVVRVPVNLCARVPDNVSEDEAAFTVVGSIGLQGIRLTQPSLGETVVVTGLGLIGLVTVQLLVAHGCRVIGIDFDPDKLEMAKSFGAQVVNLADQEDPISVANMISSGKGADAVIITASSTSNEPVHQAALMCRKRGRIVLVGVTGLELSRADFFEKELSFQVSCSYGPGRYDPNYEDKGVDYPIGYVRWTEQRNFEAVLDMMATGRLDVKPLISHRFKLDDAPKAYDVVGGSEPSLGILLEYPTISEQPTEQLSKRTVVVETRRSASKQADVAVIGSGNYANGVLIPAFKKANARIRTVVSSGGMSGLHAARKHDIRITTTDTEDVFTDNSINTIVIATHHKSHADFVCQALNSGKNVFVEKPLCMNIQELNEISKVYQNGQNGDFRKQVSSAKWNNKNPFLMVGFNRRFSPHIRKVKSLLTKMREPKSFIMTVNAGDIPADHWTQDPEVGGGRVIGEACHFVDLLRFLAGSPIAGFHVSPMGKGLMDDTLNDKVSFTLHFEDGSIGTVHYFSNGHKSFPKERLEVFCGGRILQLDNFRSLFGFGWPGFKKMRLLRQDKGQNDCVASFIHSIKKGGVPPIPFDEIVEVSQATIQISEAMKE
ncbi:Alcohol dehydrogenase zinc-binding domain protein [Desulfatibacillum aliphaticivorans]|uniref:Alcohol dehydrogenase zinc-binding domain protein n=1 Tax=Desulfatibacillum aliphaticivorans TaxID=218208 RepID=B8F9U1_DESAL|nr:bi-domain-containing oxidoreductase [Desulfatibacillum aliphaticivorans]ACL03037.1 Alcohol dehydrogenase zinc-binding domain protein [Desulfatibacillum aliphaticivorans]